MYVHKILGIPLSVVFVLWFLSGFAMIWHSFPRARQPIGTEAISRAVPPADSLLAAIPDSAKVKSLSIFRKYGRDAVKISSRDTTLEFFAEDFRPVPAFSESLRPMVLRQWCEASIKRVDTLDEVDQWIPFERWTERLPIYKYHFDDAENHQLYMTADGDVIQFTSDKDRRWAWLSAIPHWLYFTPLRRHQDLWTDVVKWSALLGCVMCISGIVLGLMVWWRQRRANGMWHCPYRKPWWRWHFVLGMLFGWCAVTFAFSGYMSMADMPSFLKKERHEVNSGRSAGDRGRKDGHRGGRRDKGIAPIDRYVLPISDVIAAGDSAVSITFAEWGGNPYYRVTYPNSSRNIDASVSEGGLKDFRLTREMVERDAARQLPDSVGYAIELLTEYDADYYGRKSERNPLPVYKVTADDYMHTVIYYDPEGLSMRTVDDDGRTRRFLYSGLHALNLKFLTDSPALWHVVMLLLLTGGSLLSLTGLVLALQWVVRSVSRIAGCNNSNKKKQ